MKRVKKENKKPIEDVTDVACNTSQDDISQEGAEEIQIELQPLNISFIQSTIQQFPLKRNDYVAIIQTHLTMGDRSACRDGFATPEMIGSKDPKELLQEALADSRLSALSDIAVMKKS